MMDDDAPPADDEPGVPAWVMTFADLMSLLLAFFVLLFSFSEMDVQKYKQIAGSMSEAFGVQRSVKVKDPPKGINIIAREFSPGRPAPTPIDTIRQMTTQDHHQNPVFTDPSEDQQIRQKPSDYDSELAQQAKDDEFQQYAKQVLNILSKEIDAGLIEVEIEDKKIIVRIQEKGSFPSGSSDVIKPFKIVAAKIALAFADVPGDVVVAGHTDNIPIHTRKFRSNWELSASRAVTVIHELSKINKIKKERFVLAAMADTQPLEKNNTAKGRARNRRVEVTLEYADEQKKSAPISLVPLRRNDIAVKIAGEKNG